MKHKIRQKKKKGLIKAYRGNKFSTAIKKLSEKYADRDIDRIQRSSFDLAVHMLKQRQDIKRQQLAMRRQMPMLASTDGEAEQDVQDVQDMQGDNQSQVDQPTQNSQMPQQSQPSQQYATGGTIEPLSTSIPFIRSNRIRDRLASLADTTAPGKSNYVVNSLLSAARTQLTTSQATKDKINEIKNNAYTPALVGDAISTAVNIGLLAGGYDKYPPKYNPYERESLALMEKRIDPSMARRNALSAFNKYTKSLRGIRSSGVKSALQANIATSEAMAMADIDTNTYLKNLQLDQSMASALANFGTQRASADLQAQQINAASKSNYQTALSQIGASMSDKGKFFTEKKLNAMQNNIVARLLNLKYRTFGLDEDVINRILSGNPTDEDLITIKKVDKSLAKQIERFREWRQKNKE